MASLPLSKVNCPALINGFYIFSPSFVGFNPRLAPVTTTATVRSFSSSELEAACAADENLIGLLQAKINAQEKELNKGFSVPESFPFKTIDRLGKTLITLKWNDFGEDIRGFVN